MKRLSLALLVLVSAAANQGCQSCCAPHDYAPPVANYAHYHQGPGRAGSVISGGHVGVLSQPEYIQGEDATEITPPQADSEAAE